MTRQQVFAPCTHCGAGVPLHEQSRDRLQIWRKKGRAYCSEGCKIETVRASSSAVMARTNRRYASTRMTANNPSARSEVRAKISATLKRIRHMPPARGGNGREIPAPQAALAALLAWPTEVTIAPGDGMRPYHYNVDMAHPTMMVYIEVDGGSHMSLARQASDARKRERLASLGWVELRFSNLEAMERTAECARTVWSTTLKWKARTPT